MIDLSEDTEALAKRVAAAQHISVEDAIRYALEERERLAAVLPARRKPKDCSPEAIAARRIRLAQFAEAIAAMPILDPRPIVEIVDDLNSL
jgi:hypothetical protein